MENILQKISEYASYRVEEQKKVIPLDEMKRKALAQPSDTGFPFKKALMAKGISFICECKKASPSKGVISPDFDYLRIAEEYEQAGASAISVLTEPKWFLGDERYLEEISHTVKIPTLRKDFTVDEYMIYHAKVLGASAVLLIVSITEEKRLEYYLDICKELGLSALVEAHSGRELETAVGAGAEIIGVNNRNLADFTVDFGNSGRLKKLCPEGTLFVAESGVREENDIRVLKADGVDAVLVGEALMRSWNIKNTLRSFIKAGGEDLP